MGTEARLAALERLVDGLAAEVTTRRLVVVDDHGRPRVVAEVSRGTAELRLELPWDDPDRRTAVVLYATPPMAVDEGEDLGLGPSIGMQLWADGDAVGEIDAWPGGDGQWQPHLHLSGET